MPCFAFRSGPAYFNRARALLSGFLAILFLAGVGVSRATAQESCRGDTRTLASTAPGRIVFGDTARLATLTAACGPVGPIVRRADRRTRFFLVVEDLRATTQPGTIFDISLAPARRGAHGPKRMLGTLNFFNAHPAAAGKGRRVSYEVTGPLKALAAHDRLSSGIALSIAPMSKAERGSDASAGAIRLLMQPG